MDDKQFTEPDPENGQTISKAESPKKDADRSISFSDVIAGDILLKDKIVRQWKLLVEIVVLVLILITIRFSVQEDILEIDRLEKIYEMEKNKALTSSSQLTEMCRQSSIEERLRSLGDSTLTAPSTPPIKININKEEEQQ